MFVLTVISTVVLTACNNNSIKTTEEEKYTISFEKDSYGSLSRFPNIFITEAANSDFTIEKAEEVESGWNMPALEGGQEIKTDIFSAKKIPGLNRLQIKITGNTIEKERNFVLYVKNGEERGKLTFNQKAYNPNLIDGLGPILFDPIYYCIDAKGGVIETATVEGIGIAPYIFLVQEIGGQKLYPPQYTNPVYFEANGLLSVYVLSSYDKQDPDLVTEVKLKLDVEPNNSGKDREIHIDVINDAAMRGYVVVLQSAH